MGPVIPPSAEIVMKKCALAFVAGPLAVFRHFARAAAGAEPDNDPPHELLAALRRAKWAPGTREAALGEE